MQQPPLLPEEALNRLLRVARMNGTSVLFASGFFALLAALGGDVTGAIAGLVVAGAGAMELHGGTLLAHGVGRGLRWLVWSQLVCLAGILVYCLVRLRVPYMPPLPAWAQEVMTQRAHEVGLTIDQVMTDAYTSSIMLLAALSTIYQGSMAIYYARRRKPVRRALDAHQ